MSLSLAKFLRTGKTRSLSAFAVMASGALLVGCQHVQLAHSPIPVSAPTAINAKNTPQHTSGAHNYVHDRLQNRLPSGLQNHAKSKHLQRTSNATTPSTLPIKNRTKSTPAKELDDFFILESWF
ncbi:hypothetical protein [Moraxella caviae]|nr:hypothetical protein [Moraxella caviae]